MDGPPAGPAPEPAGPPEGGSGRPPGRVLALDLGEARIGLAVSDSRRVLAIPHGVLERSGDRLLDRQRLAELAREVGASEVVVGLPRSLDGSLGPAARAVLAELAELEAAVGLPCRTVDERLSTVEAARRRVERSQAGGAGAAGRFVAGAASRRRRGRRGGGRRGIDAEAAAVILQAYLDAQRRRGRPL